MGTNEQHWFHRFQVESEDRPDDEIIWDDQFVGIRAPRKPTRAEKLSIVLVGVTAIGLIILMIVTLLVAIYISR
jgi:hypothetical protein